MNNLVDTLVLRHRLSADMAEVAGDIVYDMDERVAIVTGSINGELAASGSITRAIIYAWRPAAGHLAFTDARRATMITRHGRQK